MTNSTTSLTINPLDSIPSPDDLSFALPDPNNQDLAEGEFLAEVDRAWQVCDRFDLQTDIWRGRILRTVRDREKANGEGRGTGFLKWLQEREISKSQAYAWIQLANSADTLMAEGQLDSDDIRQFSKRAFLETAQSSPEIQQLIVDAARSGEKITRREVRQLSDEWTAMSSEHLPDELKEKVAAHTIPTRYIAPLVREIDKLPEAYQTPIKQAIADGTDLDNIKSVTADAQRLSKYLTNTSQVQAITQRSVNVDLALEEALRLGCLKLASDLVSQASQLEQAIGKLYSSWKKISQAADQLYVEAGSSTPHLIDLLNSLDSLASPNISVQIGNEQNGRTIRLQITEE
ncbi:MAG: hypothetical protein NW214_16070 [Pseudanabaenaceae cyanobacterium bins.39]|nr:hypothetical protein [Pseudanabaenaceae cyanobacterium bins.39]